MAAITTADVTRAAAFADDLYVEMGFDPTRAVKGEDFVPKCGIPVMVAAPRAPGEEGACWISKCGVTDEAPRGYVISYIEQVPKSYLSLLVYQRFFHWIHRNPEPSCRFGG